MLLIAVKIVSTPILGFEMFNPLRLLHVSKNLFLNLLYSLRANSILLIKFEVSLIKNKLA